jgi:hypothetical protein
VLTLEEVHFDTALNLLWLILGFFALVATVRSKQRTTRLQVLVVTVVVAALFPIISASDDLVRIEQAAQPNGVNEQLVRLYTTMEAPLKAEAPQVNFTLCFIFLVRPLSDERIERSEPIGIGRSPPSPVS